ncbi:hypothetical protein L195_g021210 [Trifolium pratense]|uniref:ACT domain-containing protein ACR n=1 Tax=Trifolium pratense TaxID=57577 RepID=A0A2K3N4J5_TRIPR|nr:hypothetical protein L195_g021210 [Trifolium pratense]
MISDYERTPILKLTSDNTVVTVQNWAERGNSVVNVQCKDRIKLLFDVVCNLTDMEYVVFHATINTNRCSTRVMYGRQEGSRSDENVPRKNGLNVTRVEVSTVENMVTNVIGVGGAVLWSTGNLVRRNLYSLGLIKSCS